VDDSDGADDGQIYALGDRNPQQGCGTLLVDQTGYYSIFDTELSESCDDQLDETGYLTVSNSCNGDGWAAERNAQDRFLVFDSDNSPDCTTDAECADGKVCRMGGGHGSCCVPDTPVFMGTFLLVAGEPNRICIHHWCPDWQVELSSGNDYGFVVNGCSGVNSIHFRIDATAIACQDESHLQPCSWGCDSGSCLPDPCDSVSCPSYCMDGICLDENPCAGSTCEHGCVRGRCLQNRHARGPDEDGDGYSYVADCDDHNGLANPGRTELCQNAVDDNCDGFIDERPCTMEDGTVLPPGGDEGGCGCHLAKTATQRTPLTWVLWVSLLGLAVTSKRNVL
jgi:hypothetical protein